MATAPVQVSVRRWWAIRAAPASIYGTLVGASVMAAVEEDTPVLEVSVTVVVTLIVYWAAERWSHVLGAHLQDKPLDLRAASRIFAHGWPMVTASYAPLITMLLARLLGVSNDAAVNVALAFTVIQLGALGALAGRRAGMAGVGIVFSAVFTGVLGVVLIGLKAIFH